MFNITSVDGLICHVQTKNMRKIFVMSLDYQKFTLQIIQER